MRPPHSPRSQAKDLANDFERSPLAVLVQQYEQHGSIFMMELNSGPTVFCGGADGPTEMFHAERASLEVYNTSLIHDLFGRAIFNLQGPEHLQARRMLRSGLSGPPLQYLAARTVELAQDHVENWSHSEFDLYQGARSLTLDACAQIILGLCEEDEDYHALPEVFETFVRGTEVVSDRRHMAAAFWQGCHAARELLTMFERRITHSRRSPDTCVLSWLVSHYDEHGMGIADLPNHLLALLIATRETTASLVTWFLVELSASHIEEDVVLEARSILVNPSWLGDPKMTPLLRVLLLETERLHSPNAVSMRTAVTDCHIGQYDIPQGCKVAFSPAANHLIPQIFQHPHDFCPRRFLQDGTDRAGLLTFGGGIHSCPGKQLAEQIVLAAGAAVFAQYHLKLPGGKPTRLRYLPVKAPVDPVPAVLNASRGSHP